jgi:hypothetical protein
MRHVYWYCMHMKSGWAFASCAHLYNNLWSDHRTLHLIAGILMNRQETKSPAYSVLVRRLAAYLVDILLLFAAVVSTQFGLAALTGGFPFRLLTTGLRIEGWV